MEQMILDFISNAAAQFPWVLLVLTVMSVARLINKPLFSFLRTFVQATPSLKDDEFLDTVERSQIYKTVSYILDLTLSIKLPEKKVVTKIEEQK